MVFTPIPSPGPLPPGPLPLIGGGTNFCVVLIGIEEQTWYQFRDYRSYIYSKSSGSGKRNEKRQLYASGSFSYKLYQNGNLTTSTSGPIDEYIPHWKQGTFLDFTTNGFIGYGGSERLVYDQIKIYSYYNEYETSSGMRTQRAGTYSVVYSDCPLSATPAPVVVAPSPGLIFLGTAAPPPPPPKKKMQCCDCNTIATIVENQSLAQLRAQEKLVENLKDHIDQRALEIIIKDLEHLKALDFEQFLKAILQRINESEANLWNGVPR
jgi:hypothetical protein